MLNRAPEKYISQILRKEISSKKLKKLSLHEPYFGKNESITVLKSITSGSVSTSGNFTKVFEKKLSKFTKSKFVIATNSGTSGLHLALIAIEVKKREEVLMPSINYIASANACCYIGATPHFIDIEEKTLGIDAEKLEKYLSKICITKKNSSYNKKTGKKISAMIVLHTFGHPANIDKIKNIAKKFKIFLIEDAAEALGSYYKKKHVGTFGDIGVLSFNGNKIITTGGGGAILTNNKKLADKVLNLANISKLNHKWKYKYDKVGYNYRMPSLNSSLGIAQMKNLKKFILEKRKLFKVYKKIFEKNNFFKLFQEPKFCKSNYWLQTIILNKDQKKLSDKIITFAMKKGIQLRPVWRPVHKSKYLKKYPKMKLTNTADLENRIINLPSSPQLTKLFF